IITHGRGPLFLIRKYGGIPDDMRLGKEENLALANPAQNIILPITLYAPQKTPRVHRHARGEFRNS
ncbi:hypothetical protein, partial [Bacteroides fluxus]|uniref:hypothetical protein n=1 Tax=Bacteroides fluxus TaxID=626930 RepID=UPI0023F04899